MSGGDWYSTDQRTFWNVSNSCECMSVTLNTACANVKSRPVVSLDCVQSDGTLKYVFASLFDTYVYAGLPQAVAKSAPTRTSASRLARRPCRKPVIDLPPCRMDALRCPKYPSR